jgi:thiol:disulfide interchange protein DsbA
MNCETIDSILDDHIVARLSAGERQRAAEHVSGCARCSAAWAADGALRADLVPEPPAELFPALLPRVVATSAQREAATRRRRWVAGAAAAAVVSAIAVLIVTQHDAINALTRDVITTVRSNERSFGWRVRLSLPPLIVGRDYEVLPGAAAQPLAAAATDEIEVTEFFMFECFPCYSFESELARWDAQKPSYVALTRVPSMFRPDAEIHARAYYTAEVLGIQDAAHAAMYDQIHVRGNRLASRAALVELFARLGVDAATFDEAFDSRAVEARVEHAIVLNREYRITSTPTLVVDGRYSTRSLDVVDQLIAESRAESQR